MSQERMRCFVERERSGWKAYCVDVDLEAEGNTWEQARAALDRALERYCYEHDDATPASGTAPLARRMRYWIARLFGHDSGAYTRRCYEFHAPPQLLTGLA
ncbi:MAG TPA: hypothetical protein VFC24_08995 [Casimicrobiaceae bacterium]|nr:hypothetical protein [Casimicrobiaceae bacterium]